MPDKLEEARAAVINFVRICDRVDCKPCGHRAALVDKLIAAACLCDSPAYRASGSVNMGRIEADVVKQLSQSRFFYTVGWGQPLFPGYIEVFAADEGEALYKMGVMFGTAWSMRYATEAEIDPADRIKRITIW